MSETTARSITNFYETGSTSKSVSPDDLLLLAIVAGLTTGVITGNKNAGFVIGGSLALLALLMLYSQGKVNRAEVEKELEQAPIEDQVTWRPALDNPKIIPFKLREKIGAA